MPGSPDFTKDARTAGPHVHIALLGHQSHLGHARPPGWELEVRLASPRLQGPHASEGRPRPESKLLRCRGPRGPQSTLLRPCGPCAVCGQGHGRALLQPPEAAGAAGSSRRRLRVGCRPWHGSRVSTP